jgi:hypothetical protein
MRNKRMTNNLPILRPLSITEDLNVENSVAILVLNRLAEK